MFKRNALILGLITFTLGFSVFTFLIGVCLGGNFFTGFELFGRRGYEAVGNLGLIVGLVLGISFSILIYWKIRIYKK
jgi:uncharacterized transporter YbjL